MILVHQRYFAKTGMAAAVLATRQRANHRLRELNLPVGRTWRPAVACEQVPDVVWECIYETMDDRRQAEMVLDNDAIFIAIRAEQGSQLNSFEHEYYMMDE